MAAGALLRLVALLVFAAAFCNKEMATEDFAKNKGNGDARFLGYEIFLFFCVLQLLDYVSVLSQ